MAAVAQRTGTMATLAIVAALGGIIVVFTGHPVWGFFIELVAIPLGIGGLVMASSPRVSGGVLSIIAILIGVLGLGVAILGMVGALVF